MLALLRNRSFGFAGDSVMLQLWDACLKEFTRYPELFRVKSFSVAQNQSRAGFIRWWGAMHGVQWFRVTSVPRHDADTVFESDIVFFKHYVWSPWDLPVLQQVDVLLYYLAFHYEGGNKRGRNGHLLSDDLREAYSFLGNFSRISAHKVAIYKQVTSSDFKSVDNEYRKNLHASGCKSHSNQTVLEHQLWRWELAKQASVAAGVRDPSLGRTIGDEDSATVYTLPVFPTYSRMASAHVGGEDCLHNCYVPAFYVPTFAMLNLVLQNSSAGAPSSFPRARSAHNTKGPFADLSCEYLLFPDECAKKN